MILLTVGWLIQAGLRVWFSRQQSMPLANPDETAYLIAARVLAGGPGADLSGSTLYQGGYPLLITPVYWFTSNPSTVYHAVLVINSLISALMLPLGYIACRRLGLRRPAAYVVATVAALVPAGFFYSEFAMTDAVFPVVTLAWLLTTHSWLTASSARVRYAAATGSAALAAFAYAMHSRGLVMLAGLAAVGALIFWRQAAARLSVLAAALTAVVAAAAAWSLNHHIGLIVYPEGTRSLSGQIQQRLASVNGTIHVLEMAAGQLWRLVLDSWGIAGIGLVAALLVIVRRDVRSDLRIMGALSVAVTTVIACTAPAALPLDQPQAWASGRYLDGMIIVFFLVGAVMLLRARMRDILFCAAVATGLFLLAAVTVAVYIGTTVPTSGFGSAFNFAEPAVLTMNWTQASVPLATAVTLVMLAVWIGLAGLLRRWRAGVPFAALAAAFGVCVAAVSLVAVAQMTSHVSRTGSVERAGGERPDAGRQAAAPAIRSPLPPHWPGRCGCRRRSRFPGPNSSSFNAALPAAADRDDRGREPSGRPGSRPRPGGRKPRRAGGSPPPTRTLAGSSGARAEPRAAGPGPPAGVRGPGGWPGRTPGTSRITGSSCIPPAFHYLA